jgi:hypothetical protein
LLPEQLWVQESSPLLFGRAATHFRQEDLFRFPEQVFRGMPCQFVTANMVVTPDLQVFACCGFGGSTAKGPAAVAYVGDLANDAFATLFARARGNLALGVMAACGPQRLLDLAREIDPTLTLPAEYVSNCAICGELSVNTRLRQAVSGALRLLADSSCPEAPYGAVAR